MENSTARVAVGYGAGPVSVQLTRGRPGGGPDRAGARSGGDGTAFAGARPPRRRQARVETLAARASGAGLLADRRTGRTSVAAQVAATLAGLPFVHIWPPALLVDTTRDRSPHDHSDEPDASERRTDHLSSLMGVQSTLRVRTTSSGIAVLQA